RVSLGRRLRRARAQIRELCVTQTIPLRGNRRESPLSVAALEAEPARREFSCDVHVGTPRRAVVSLWSLSGQATGDFEWVDVPDFPNDLALVFELSMRHRSGGSVEVGNPTSHCIPCATSL